MPKIRVRDKQSGKVDFIDWNDESRPPTRDEIKSILAGTSLSLKPEQYKKVDATPEPEEIEEGLGIWGNIANIPSGAAAGLASTIYHGGDWIRRGLGMERIIGKPEVQEAITPPEGWGGQTGFYGEQVGEFLVPGAAIGKATKGLNLAGRLGAEGLWGGLTAGLQSGGDPKSMAIGTGAGIIAPPVAQGIGKLAGAGARFFGYGVDEAAEAAARARASKEAADTLLGKTPSSAWHAEQSILGPGTSRNTEEAASTLFGPAARMGAREAESTILGHGVAGPDQQAADILLGAQPAPTIPRKMGTPEAEDLLLGPRQLPDERTLPQSPWIPPTQRPSRQLPQVASSTGSRFLGGQAGAPIDVTAPIPAAAEAEILAGSGQTEAAARAVSGARKYRTETGAFKRATPEEKLSLPSQENAPPFTDLSPEEQSPYLDWLGRDIRRPTTPPLPAGLSDTELMAVLRQNELGRTIRNPATTTTARTGVPTSEYVGQLDYTPKISGQGAPRGMGAVGAVEAPVVPSPQVAPEIPAVSAPPTAMETPTQRPAPWNRLFQGAEPTVPAPTTPPAVRQLENEFGRPLTNAELGAIGEEGMIPPPPSPDPLPPTASPKRRGIFERFRMGGGDRGLVDQADDLGRGADVPAPSAASPEPTVPSPEAPRTVIPLDDWKADMRRMGHSAEEIDGAVREAQAAGIDPTRSDDLYDLEAYIKSAEPPKGPKRPFGDESGQAPTELVRHTTGATLGGAFGGMHGDTSEERWKNAAIGALVGGGLSVVAGGKTRPKGTTPITQPKANPFTPAGRKRLVAEFGDALNIPRAIQASSDLSAAFRQAANMIHKKEYWNNLPSMVKAFSSEKHFKALQTEIAQRPSYSKMKEAKLALTDLGSTPTDREELFMSKMAESIPVAGRLIRASGRGYVGFLNKLRADSFDSLLSEAEKSGAKTTPKAIAEFVNNATGRGDLGKFEGAAPFLNALFFSPRLMAARINMMNPKTYMKADPFVRKEYLKSMAGFGAAWGSVLALAKANGAKVETDPRSSDFAKIRMGKFRLDVGAGYQQYIRAATQWASGQRKDLKTGKIQELGKKFKDPTSADVAREFFEAKASPIASFMIDWSEGKDFKGEKFEAIPKDWSTKEVFKSGVGRRLTPMIMQDTYEVIQEDPAMLPLMIPAFFGAAVQVHQPRKVRTPL